MGGPGEEMVLEVCEIYIIASYSDVVFCHQAGGVDLSRPPVLI